MDSGERPWLQRLATDSTGPAKANTHVVDVCCSQVGNGVSTEVRVEIAVEHGAGLTDRGRS